VDHLKPGLFCPILQYLSSFQMVAAILFLPSKSRTEVFLTSSLDFFGMKNILFMSLFFETV
jgi:hypothetical protein